MALGDAVTIYALVDPRDGATRYIGQTTSPLPLRLSQHLLDNRHAGNPKHEWLCDLERDHLRPRIIPLVVAATADADAVERRMIAACVEGGATLTNTRHNMMASLTGRSMTTHLRRTTRPRVEKNVTIRFSEEMRARLDRVAAHRDIAVGTMIRDMIEAWLPVAERDMGAGDAPPENKKP